METNEAFGEGSYIIFVNGGSKDETPLGRLMHGFSRKVELNIVNKGAKTYG